VVAVNAATVQSFENLFKKLTIQGMLNLDWESFQPFVQYVFECAGYVVEYVGNRHYSAGPGVDLNLHEDNTHVVNVADEMFTV
jgi:hypothetical protein